MPEIRTRPLPLAGLNDLGAMPDAAGFADCDRARVIDQGDTLAAWPGHRRVSPRLLQTTEHGPTGNRIQIIGADEALVRKGAGHLLAAIDRAPGTDGRVLGIAHVTGGVNGSRMVGRPVKTAGAGTLDDLDAGGVLSEAIDWQAGGGAGIYAIEITTAAGGGDTFKWSRDGSTASHGTKTMTSGDAGAWLDLEKGIRVRFAAHTGHTVGDRWLVTVGGRPMLLAELERFTPHDYVAYAGAGGRTLLGNAWNRAHVDDGRQVREAGLAAPQIKPVTITSGGSETDLAATDANPVEWTAGPGIAIRRKTASPDPARGTAYISFDMTKDTRTKGQVLGYHNVSATIPATCKRLRMYLYTEGLRRGKIPRKAIQFIAASAVALGGTTVAVTIPASVQARKWCHVDIPWQQADDFSVASIGITLAQTLPRAFFRDADPDLSLYLDSLRMVAGETSSATLDEAGEYRVCFTWLDQATGRESAPSPASEPLKLTGSALSIDLAGYEPGMAAGLPNTPPAGATGVHVYVANPVWGTDPRLGTGLSYFRVTPDTGLELSKLMTGSNGELQLAWGDELSKALITAPDQERQPFFNSQPRPGDCLVGDGNLIVSAVTHDHRVGRWTWTENSHVITPAAGDGAPTPAVWMEGRQIRRDGDDESYLILKALDQDADGVLDALWIGTDFNPDEQELASAYQGTSGDGAATILGDRKTIHWTNETEQFGVDAEASSLLNQLTIMDGADDIVGLGKAGEFLWVIGTRNAYVLRQTPGALADQPTAGTAYSNPLHLPGIGMAARRTWTARPDGSALFLGSRGQLYVANGTSAQLHPASDRLAAILSGMGMLADPGALRHAFAELVSNGEDEYWFLALVAGTVSRESPGVLGDGTGAGGATDTHALTPAEPFIATGAIDWSAYEVVSGCGSPPIGAANTLGDAMIHAPNYDYSAVVAFDQGAIGDWNYADAAAAAAGALQSPSVLWTPDETYTATELVAARVKTGAQCPTESHVDSEEHPAAVISDGSAGGVGYYEGGRWFPRGFYGVACHRLTFKSALFISNALVGSSTLFHFRYEDIYGQTTEAVPVGQVARDGDELVFQVYYETTAGTALPAGTLGLDCAYASEGYAYQAPIDYLPELAPNAWTTVRLPIVANNLETDLLAIDRFFIWAADEPALEAALTAGGGTFHLRLANGRTELAGETPTPPDPDADPLAFEGCKVPGTEIVTSALATDFDLGLLIDLKRGLVFAGRECRWTCPGLASASSCSSTAMLPAPNFMGDRDGYLSLTFDEATYSWGSPATRFVYPIASGGASTATIDRDTAAGENVLTLALDMDGVGILAGLVVAKLTAADVIEWRRIASNTVDTVTVTEAWATAPAAGDTLIVAPLPACVTWGEVRARRPMSLRELALDLQDGHAWQAYGAGELDPWGMIEVLAADPLRTRATLEQRVAATFRGLDVRRGLGRIRVAPHVSRSLAYRLTLLGPQTAPLMVRNLAVAERVQTGEAGR